VSGPAPRIRGRDFAIGLTAATALWTVAFSRKQRFWETMAIGVGSLGAFALYANPALRKTTLKPRDLAVGLGTAVGLYGVFQVGDRVARRAIPSGAADIEDIYLRRTLAPRKLIAPALALLIAPGEELFWRGLFQGHLQEAMGAAVGAAIVAWLVYVGANLTSGSLPIVAGAVVGGALWTGLAWWSGGVLAGLAQYATSGNVTRLAGSDRYATAVAVTSGTFAPGPIVFVATGVNFPDALGGGPVAGGLPGPLLLVPGTFLPSSVAGELSRLNPDTVIILGGTNAVSADVAYAIESLLSD